MQVNATRQQKRAIRWILEAGKDRRITDGTFANATITKFTVEPVSPGSTRLFVVLNTIPEGSEKDMRSILCSRHGCFVVGPQGGIKALNYPKGDKTKARKYPLIWGWRT